MSGLDTLYCKVSTEIRRDDDLSSRRWRTQVNDKPIGPNWVPSRMTALYGRFLVLLVDARHQKGRAMVLHGSTGILTVLVGILGVQSDSSLRGIAERWVNIHALFGLLLCALVIARFHWRVMYLRPVRPAELRELTRHLSRLVYLTLYLVIGAKLVMGIVESLSRGIELGLGRTGAAPCTSTGCTAFQPTKDFQAILLYGIVTLVLIRALTFSFSLRALDRGSVARPQQPIPRDLK
jgi:cytochrome b561